MAARRFIVEYMYVCYSEGKSILPTQRYHSCHPQTLHPILPPIGIMKSVQSYKLKTVLILGLILKHIV